MVVEVVFQAVAAGEKDIRKETAPGYQLGCGPPDLRLI
jgi:hypothetical protein